MRRSAPSRCSPPPALPSQHLQLLLPLLLSPPDPDPSLHLLEIGEEEVRAPPPPSPRKRRRRIARRSSPWRRSRFPSPRSPRSPPSPPTPPATPPSARMRVLLRVFPHGLIVVFVRFVRSPARLPHYVRCSAAPFAEAPPMIMGTLVREVDCCVPCRSITTPRQMFSCGRPRKNPWPFETGIDPY